MATTKENKEYILEQLDSLNNIVCRPMMGEYLLYCDSVLFGGIYDNKVLIKRVESNKKFELEEVIPYKGAKPMYFLEDLDNKDLTKEIVTVSCKELSLLKKK